jgi:DNA-binding NarL/FixJ family response regulator
MKIILVDDNKEFLENLEFFIVQKLGYKVLASFSDGMEFYKKISNYKPDIILMDISMPGIDGYTVTKMINWNNVHLKVIAVTMFTNKAYLEKLIGAGFKGCVFKSDVFKELPVAIEEVSKGQYYWPVNIND